MGVVARQTVKNNILAYVGVIIGVLANIYIYPMDLAVKGFLDTLIRYAQILIPFLVFGGNVIMVKFLPYSLNERKTAAIMLFTRTMLVTTIVISGLLLLDVLIGPQVYALIEGTGIAFVKVQKYSTEIILMGGAIAYASLITTHLINFHRAAIPVIFNAWVLKLTLPCIILATYHGLFDKEVGLIIVCGALYLAVVGLLLYARSIGVFAFKWGRLRLQNATTKDMYNLAAYSILGSAGSVLAIQIDTVMVNGYLGDESTAIYTFSAFSALVISIPYKAINGITSPLVAAALQANDQKELSKLYQQASQVLYAIGVLVFVGMVVCLPYVYNFTENTRVLAIGYTATLLLGGGQLVDQLCSINAIILGQSEYYKWNVWFMVAVAVLNVSLNFYFLGTLELGLEGAALATMISLCAFNLIKAVFIYSRIGIQPLTWSILYSTLALMAIGSVAALFPDILADPYLNVLIRGSIIVILFLVYIRYTKGVPPVKAAMLGGLKKIFM